MQARPSPIPSAPPMQEPDQPLEFAAFLPPADFAARAQVTDPGIYAQAEADAPAWWAEQARQRLDWDTPFEAVLDDSNPPFYTWFADGTLNASYNCLDRHVKAGHADRVAFRWHGEQGEERSLTYGEILADTQRLANALKAQGIRKGDIVGIYQPMIPEGVKTEASDKAITANYVEKHIKVGIEALKLVRRHGRSVKHLRFEADEEYHDDLGGQHEL